jgi:hypothetical protein
MGRLVELPITVYNEGEVSGVQEEYDVELCIELEDIRWIHPTESGMTYAMDFSGNPIEINLPYEDFKRVWLRGRKVERLTFKPAKYEDVF